MAEEKMDEFRSILSSSVVQGGNFSLIRSTLTTLQVNMGNLCNQSCAHCHIDASPEGRNIMSRKVVDDILKFLSHNKVEILDITGGAPELNPNFEHLVRSARPLVDEIIVRSNLTVIFEKGKEYLPNFFKKNKIHLICSLPCYTEKNVNLQRGTGVFEKSIKALRLLNDLGFSKEEGLSLDLVYNPIGAFLPPKQEELEKDYKQILRKTYGIDFNGLITITNVPIKRFKDYLESSGEYEKYLELLKNNFNPLTINSLMCRMFLSVGFDGKLYDCDFNQALCLVLKNEEGDILTIDKISAKDLDGRDIILGEHCLACTAGYGSSCQGALAVREDVDSCFPALDKKKIVKDYYGKILKNKQDLQTTACCYTESFFDAHQEILKQIHPEIRDKFYGCGSPIPPELQGCTVLDLGSGTGRDVYIVSRLVGAEGFVIGVDMTEEQLKVAKRHIDFQMEQFGYARPNVEFKQGHIEDLSEIGIKDNSIDVVISNCVINLSVNKRLVFNEIFRVLKPGGELYFSDVFSGRRVPKELRDDPVIYGECLGGALYIADFRRILREIGCLDYRIISKRRLTLNNSELAVKVGMIDFYSMTIRAFKVDGLEDACEDYGQYAIYLGTIPGYPHQFALDEGHIFITGKPMLICGNSALMLEKTRYAKHFRVFGDRTTHYGSFNCMPTSVRTKDGDFSVGGARC
jgi:radical SAM/Cys-rich protein